MPQGPSSTFVTLPVDKKYIYKATFKSLCLLNNLEYKFKRPTGCGSSMRGSQAGTIRGLSHRGLRMLRAVQT